MTLHILNNLEQGTDEWLAARRGMVTASVVGKLLTVEAPDALTVGCSSCSALPGSPCLSAARKEPTPIKTFHDSRSSAASELPPTYKAADNETSRALTATLVAERITGLTEPSYMNDDMIRGVEAEPIARDIYSGFYQQAVEVGYMRRDEAAWSLGYSPDGVVGDDGLIEIKAPRAKGHILTILTDEVPPYYMPQCQAGLLVSGRKWLDFVSFHGGLSMFVKRVYPDPKWFDAITAACIRFEQAAAHMVADYEAAAINLPKTERLNFEIQVA